MEILAFFVGYIIIASAWNYFKQKRSAGTPPSLGRPAQPPLPGGFEVRLHRETKQGNHHPYEVVLFQARGPLPIQRRVQLIAIASILDVTTEGSSGEEARSPVVCLIDAFQEPDSRCYQDKTELGEQGSGSTATDWATLAVVIPETLQTSHSGTRTLRIFLNLCDSANLPTFSLGFYTGQSPLHTSVLDFQWTFADLGYQEVGAQRLEAEELTVRAAVSVAASDGTIADAEGRLLQKWVKDRLELLDESQRPERRDRFNTVLREAFADAKRGTLNLDAELTRFAQLRDEAAKLDALHLCLDIMAADGHADNVEMKLVQHIAQRLGVEHDSYNHALGKRVASLTTTSHELLDFYALLGIDRAWDSEKVRKHLNSLYAQWNSRAESQSDPQKRKQAESMLENIAAARQALLDR
jgi:tellurite resistance protein